MSEDEEWLVELSRDKAGQAIYFLTAPKNQKSGIVADDPLHP